MGALRCVHLNQLLRVWLMALKHYSLVSYTCQLAKKLTLW